MNEGLSQRLASGRSSPAPKEKDLCLIVDERAGFSCEFQTVEGDAWLFPYARLTYAEAPAVEGVLRVGFSSHLVTIEGANLQKIREGIARGRNVLVRAVETSRRSEYTGDDVFVSCIQVLERKGKESPEEEEANHPS